MVVWQSPCESSSPPDSYTNPMLIECGVFYCLKVKFKLAASYELRVTRRELRQSNSKSKSKSNRLHSYKHDPMLFECVVFAIWRLTNSFELRASSYEKEQNKTIRLLFELRQICIAIFLIQVSQYL
jgi:hypothetical protein